MEFNNVVWRYKKERGIALSQKIEAPISAPKNLEPFKDDLMTMHKINNLSFSTVEDNIRIQS